MSKTLENQCALISGASRGIGKAIDEKFIESGYAVVVGYNNSKEEADALATNINAYTINISVAFTHIFIKDFLSVSN